LNRKKKKKKKEKEKKKKRKNFYLSFFRLFVVELVLSFL
jgi:hypothetical protein